MHLRASGILSDYQGRVLLQRVEPRTLIPITRPFETGTLPTDILARAFRDDTGLYVMPVRLTNLSYAPGQDELAFSFRCTMRGGDLDTRDGPPAGFFDLPLPGALAKPFRGQVEQALHHAGGPPVMERADDNLAGRLGRIIGGRRPVSQGHDWAVKVRLVVSGGDGQLLWVRSGVEETWGLPSAAVTAGDAPWETAGRLLHSLLPDGAPHKVRLVAGLLAAERPALELIFVADVMVFTERSGDTINFAHHGFKPQFGPNDVMLVESIDWRADNCQWLIAAA